MVAPGPATTVVTKIRGSDRTALATQRLAGQFEIPAVAGVQSGLSNDGRTLVLGGHPAAHVSRLVLLDTRSLRVRRTLTLHGTYSFDAMSPDASTLYVLRFLNQDGTHYAVQALDLTDSQPVPKTVVEKGEPGENMSGQALTRTMSPDNGWVYTLYDGAGKAPFVHALSTVDKFTVCIDLDGLEGRSDLEALDLSLRPGSHRLAVTSAGTPLALIDTGTFEVTTPPAAATTKPTPRPQTAKEEAPSSGVPWLPLAAIALALTGALAAAKTRQTQQKPHKI